MNDLKQLPVSVEQTFKTPIKDVWAAITQPALMKQWFFEQIESFVPVVGFSTQFNVNTGNRDFLHQWELLEVIPIQKIIYNWKYNGYAGESLVTFELNAQGDYTILKLTHENTKDYPSAIPEFSRDSCLGGWKYFINERLYKFLEE